MSKERRGLGTMLVATVGVFGAVVYIHTKLLSFLHYRVSHNGEENLKFFDSILNDETFFDFPRFV